MKDFTQMMVGIIILFLSGCASQQPVKSAVSEREVAETYLNRGIAYSQKGEYKRAWEDVHKAQGLGYPVSPGFLKTLRETTGRQR